MPAASDSKRHKNANDQADDISKITLFTRFKLYHNLGSKHAKFSILRSISPDHLNLAESSRYTIQ